MDMTEFVYQFVMCNLEVAKELLFLIYIIGFPMVYSKKKILYISVVSVMVMIYGCMKVEPVFIPILYLLVALIGAGIFIEIRNTSRFLLSIISFLCISEIDFFIGALFRLTVLGDILAEKCLSLVVSIIGFIIWFVISRLCIRFDIAFYRKKASKSKLFIAIEIIVLFINIGVLTIMFGILSEETGRKEILLLLAAMFILFVVSTVSLIFYSSAVDVRKYKKLDAMNQVYLLAQKEHYEKIKRNDKESRKFRHDLGNHLMVIASLLDEEKTEKAKEYIREMHGKLEKIRIKIRTGNDILDAIINDKAEKAKELGAVIDWEGVIPAKVSLSDLDICTIFANALDNAIEACGKYQGERIIKVIIRNFENFLRIIISNPTEGKADICTTKKNKKKHGFGLPNIISCVEKNYGQVDIGIEENQFVLDIIIKAFDVL